MCNKNGKMWIIVEVEVDYTIVSTLQMLKNKCSKIES